LSWEYLKICRLYIAMIMPLVVNKIAQNSSE